MYPLSFLYIGQSVKGERNECNKTFSSIRMEIVKWVLDDVDRYTLVLDVSDDYQQYELCQYNTVIKRK